MTKKTKKYTAAEREKAARVLGHFGGLAKAKKRPKKAQPKRLKKASTTIKAGAKKRVKVRKNPLAKYKQATLF